MTDECKNYIAQVANFQAITHNGKGLLMQVYNKKDNTKKYEFASITDAPSLHELVDNAFHHSLNNNLVVTISEINFL